MKLNRFFFVFLPFCLNASLVNFSAAIPINPSFYDENAWNRLKSRVEGNIVHTEGVCDALRNLLRGAPDANLDQVSQVCRKNISELRVLINRLEETKQQPNLLEKTIQNLLCMRLDNLRLRKEKIELVKKEQALPGNNNLYFQGRTHSDRYETLYPEEKIMSLLSIDIYQTQGDAIVTLLSFTNMRELLSKTKDWIACSPTLWDRIRGLDTDLGHPDEAILDVQDNFYKGLDLDLLEAYLRPSCPFVTHDYSTFYKSRYKVSISLTPFDYQEIMGRPYGSNVKLPPLKIPAFLEKLPPVQQPSLQPEPVVQTTKKTQKLEAPKPAKKVVVPVEQEIFIPEPAPVVEIKVNPPMAEKAAEVEVESEALDTTSVVKKPEKPLASIAAPVALPSAQKIPLKGTHAKIHEAIFNVSKGQKVSFKEFKILWEHLEGEIPSNRSRGSHRTIKWQNQTIGGTYEPHNGGAYSPRSISFLREALTKIGYGATH